SLPRRDHGQKRKASRRPDKNAGSVFEQRHALARLRAHLRDDVRNRAGRACHGWRLLHLSDLTVFSSQSRSYSKSGQPVLTT
ncbi:MAG TPA: hypothetical protein DCL47_00130, partial [Pantoea agglomerans]|nr:hypothetical protein [Pantoea agglomerans]